MRPEDLARELSMPATRLRGWLRETYPRVYSMRYQPWHLSEAQVEAARARFGRARPPQAATEIRVQAPDSQSLEPQPAQPWQAALRRLLAGIAAAYLVVITSVKKASLSRRGGP
jgi:hypothetical protein